MEFAVVLERRRRERDDARLIDHQLVAVVHAVKVFPEQQSLAALWPCRQSRPRLWAASKALGAVYAAPGDRTSVSGTIAACGKPILGGMMHTSISFLTQPLPMLDARMRLLLAFIGGAGLLAVGFWLHAQGWPVSPHATADLFLLPLVLLAISVGLPGAVGGILLVTATLFWLAEDQMPPMQVGLRSANIAAITLLVAVLVHLQAHFRRQLARAVMHDPGTGLPGRRALWRALDRELQEREPGSRRDGLLVVALDNLDDITATFGYEAGDELIVRICRQINEVLPPEACVFHYCHNRLAAVFRSSGEDIDALAQALIGRLGESTQFDGVSIFIATRLGFVRLTGQDCRLMINQAEAAIEVARERELIAVTYSPGMGRDRKRALMLLGDLSVAKRDGSLTMHYQPKVRLSTMELHGYEALARWQHPVLGTVSPAEFIPIIERTDCIHAFSLWAVETSLLAMHEQWTAPASPTSIAVNISSHNLMAEDFPARIRGWLAEHRIPASMLELEVTESEIMKHPERAIEVLQQLADIPITIAIDDFGTGYSSLAYLNRLPATTIKIDRGFIKAMSTDAGAKSIVAAAIDLAHALGMQVVAEGIETADQLETLRELGCDVGQGYLFSPAMPIGEAVAWRPRAAAPSQ